MEAKRAFLNFGGGRVELRGPVRTGLNAVLTTDTNSLVDQHNPVCCAFENRIRFVGGVVNIRNRAGSQTGRMFTVITGAGNKREVWMGINPGLFLDDPAVADMVRQHTSAIFKRHGGTQGAGIVF